MESERHPEPDGFETQSSRRAFVRGAAALGAGAAAGALGATAEAAALPGQARGSVQALAWVALIDWNRDEGYFNISLGVALDVAPFDASMNVRADGPLPRAKIERLIAEQVVVRVLDSSGAVIAPEDVTVQLL